MTSLIIFCPATKMVLLSTPVFQYIALPFFFFFLTRDLYQPFSFYAVQSDEGKALGVQNTVRLQYFCAKHPARQRRWAKLFNCHTACSPGRYDTFGLLVQFSVDTGLWNTEVTIIHKEWNRWSFIYCQSFDLACPLVRKFFLGWNRFSTFKCAIVAHEHMYYNLSGHPSGPENWPFFQRSHVCTWQLCRTSKSSATHPAFSPVRNVSRLFFCCAQWAKICYSRGTADEKWRPLTVWTLGQRILVN